jgi:hypothetical protein
MFMAKGANTISEEMWSEAEYYLEQFKKSNQQRGVTYWMPGFKAGQKKIEVNVTLN